MKVDCNFSKGSWSKEFLNGGADYYVTDTVAFFAEGGYIWSDYDANIRAGGAVVAANVDTDAAYVVGGVKLGF